MKVFHTDLVMFWSRRELLSALKKWPGSMWRHFHRRERSQALELYVSSCFFRILRFFGSFGARLTDWLMAAG